MLQYLTLLEVRRKLQVRVSRDLAIFEKHGAEFLRMSLFHTGAWAGEWLIVSRYASWEVHGKAQEGVAKAPASQS
jgi:hypothetical protein